MLPSETVEASLRQRIASGEWDHGDRLPTLADLADEYHVSRGTVNTVLRKLADEGLLIIRSRWGTFKS